MPQTKHLNIFVVWEAKGMLPFYFAFTSVALANNVVECG